jgi:hypothetical protein
MAGKFSGAIETVEPGEAYLTTLNFLKEFVLFPIGLEHALESDDSQVVQVSVVEKIAANAKPKSIEKYAGDELPHKAYVHKKSEKEAVLDEITDDLAEKYKAKPDDFDLYLVVPRMSRNFSSADVDTYEGFQRRAKAFVKRIESMK